jgi:hypothetical protein
VTSNSQIITTIKEPNVKRRDRVKKERDLYGDAKELLALDTSALTVVVLARNL